MKHIIDLANTLYVWPSWTRHGVASPAWFLPCWSCHWLQQDWSCEMKDFCLLLLLTRTSH